MGALKRFRRLRASFDYAYRSAATVFPQLQQMGVPVQVFVCTGYARDGGPLSIPELAGDDPQELATMTWDELRGLDVGSQGVTHAHLTRLGRTCVDFAYPYGEHDDRVRAAVRAVGYEHAYGLVDDGEDRYALRRLDLYRRHTPVRALLRLYA